MWDDLSAHFRRTLPGHITTDATYADRRAAGVTDDQGQFRRALLPLIHNRDGHFLATLSVLLLSPLEGETDYSNQRSVGCWQNPC